MSISEPLDGTTVTRMLADYRIVLNRHSVCSMASVLEYAARHIATRQQDRDMLALLAECLLRSDRVGVGIPVDIPGDETGDWTTPNRDLVCRLEEIGAEVM